MSNSIPYGISLVMADSQYSTPDFISDRGPAEYFHGREKILANFNALAQKAVEEKGGSTFLIQGAPGAGKTALLYECELLAQAQKWEVANIGIGALWDGNKLLASLGLGEKFKGTERSTQIGLKNFLGWGFKSTRPQPTVMSTLQDRGQPLLLILDEAHGLGEDGIPPDEYKEDARTVLEFIHNGKLERPVILLAAGLGTSKTSFGLLGISRFKGGCLVELGALSKESERAVIRDWLEKAGGAKGDLTTWIEAIASETHGWPQHIISYGDPAAKLLQKNNGDMTPELLDRVLQVGARSREQYYQGRAVGLLKKHRICLAEVVKEVPVGYPVDIDLVESSLRENFGKAKAEELLHLIHLKGILDERNGEYFVPVPSMHTWLVETYAKEREKTAQSGDKHGLDSPAKTLGIPRETIDVQLTPRDIQVEQDATSSSKEKNLPDQSPGWER